jgi:predicted Zn finger-like uncharacterized protein
MGFGPYFRGQIAIADMILTCPACNTRYNADEAKFPSQGRTVRCAKCGHSWHQSGPEPELAADPQATSAPQTPIRGEAAAIPTLPSDDRAFAPPAQISERSRGNGLQILGLVIGWISLIAAVLLIGYSAVRYRQDIVTIWPQSAGVYSGLGLKVNANGIGFADVAYKRGSEDGQSVLTVSGAIVNTAGRELPVPQTVRVTLSDADNHELYHQDFKPDAITLQAGGRLLFRTRISSPPAAARAADVSFAKGGS